MLYGPINLRSQATWPLLLAMWLGTFTSPLIVSPSAVSADDAAQANPSENVLQEAAVRQELDAVKETTDLDDVAKQEVLDLYQQALANLARQAELEQSIASNLKTVETTDALLAKVQAELDKEPPASGSAFSEESPLEQLEEQLQQFEDEFELARQQLQDLDAEPARRQSRRTEIPGQRDFAEGQIKLIEAQLGAEPPDGEPESVTRARRTHLRSQLQVFQQELTAYDQELAAYDATIELLRLQRDLAAINKSIAESRLGELRIVVNSRQREEAQEEVRHAEQVVKSANAALQPIARQNSALAVENDKLVKQIESAGVLQSKVFSQRDEFGKMVQSTLAKIEQVGQNEAMGLLLRRQKASLPDGRLYQKEKAQLDRDIRTTQLRLLDLDAARSKLAVIDDMVEQYMSTLNEIPPGIRRKDLEIEVRDLYKSQRDHLDSLIENQNRYFNVLVELSNAEQQLIEDSRAYTAYIDARVLWIRSTDVLNWTDLRVVSADLQRFLTPSQWAVVLDDLGRDFAGQIEIALSFVAILALLLYVNRRSQRRLGKLGAIAGRRDCRNYGITVEALLLTLVVALPGPLILFFFSWRLYETSDGAFELNVARAFRQTGFYFLLFGLLRKICCPLGLASAHFSWSEETCRAIYREIRWFLWIFLPIVFGAITLDSTSEDARDNPLGRICLIIFLAAVIVLDHRLLRPRGPIFSEKGAVTHGWPYRLRYFWYAIGILIPISQILLLVLGYVFTAEKLVPRIVWMMWMLFGLLLACSMLLRWLRIKRRRLVFLHDQQQSANVGTSNGDEEVHPASQLFVPGTPTVDFDAIGQQSRKLINAVFATIAIVGVWMVWSDVLPALAALDNVDLWQVTKGERVESITLARLLLSILIMLMTILAVRNLPGVLELVLFQRLPLDSAIRYAAVAILRYVMTMAGIVATCHLLGLVWSDIQWLAAAATVGLGFGLQEIFANFVSGLILLTEQPIRIGDIVTVDNVTGVVSKIRMRATVVTDWDRKEFIIPNKDFVAGRVLNWSLTNTTNRVVIMVRVPRDADITRVRNLLLQVAEEHPVVLEDPNPMATIEEFGESSIHFALRCYLPSMDGRLGIKHELHAEIHRLFGDAEVDLAYPQRDVHIQSDA